MRQQVEVVADAGAVAREQARWVDVLLVTVFLGVGLCHEGLRAVLPFNGSVALLAVEAAEEGKHFANALVLVRVEVVNKFFS